MYRFHSTPVQSYSDGGCTSPTARRFIPLASPVGTSGDARGYVGADPISSAADAPGDAAVGGESSAYVTQPRWFGKSKFDRSLKPNPWQAVLQRGM